MRRSEKIKFYKKEKDWLIFKTGPASAGHIRTVIVLTNAGKKISVDRMNVYDMLDTSYYKDVYEHLTNDD